jgi:hypothetical protein
MGRENLIPGLSLLGKMPKDLGLFLSCMVGKILMNLGLWLPLIFLQKKLILVQEEIMRSAIYLPFWILPKRFDIKIISGIFGSPRISVDPG